ncbi:hypothetical protein [Plantactinospora sp. KLBMP9567]|uniref:hypothetical protein n=1 Tax=Plantactinospora sp. KLBMP9567 TaxID=3085900 RepID=UPI0029811A98|nr:hypothetical protein [Plantactinospora sp. KLBMP9567]MDW5330816.1 hypothetical protein [Plantactinospora sp. KLBMP9567]
MASVAIQALGALVAGVVAIPALVVALSALEDQQEINRSQIRLNQIEQDRFNKRYASRVAVWMTGEPGSFKLQNRAPVPLSVVQLRFGSLEWEGGRAYSYDWFHLPTMPPCTILSIELPTVITIYNQKGATITLRGQTGNT